MVESIANIVRAWPADRARHGQPYFALELICSAVEAPGGRRRDGVVDQHPLRADDGGRARRGDQRRLPRRQARPRSTASSPDRARAAARAGVRDAVSQGAKLRLLADRRRRRARRPRRSSRSPAPRSRRARPRSCASSSPRRPRSSRSSPAGCIAARRTSSCARSASGCPRAGCCRRSTAPRCAPPSAPRTAACSGSRPSSPPTAARCARRSPPRCSRAAARTGFTAGGWSSARASTAGGSRARSARSSRRSARLVSAAEVAHLLELPSARMKGVPVRRVTIPRIPAPPEVARGSRPRPGDSPHRRQAQRPLRDSRRL